MNVRRLLGLILFLGACDSGEPALRPPKPEVHTGPSKLTIDNGSPESYDVILDGKSMGSIPPFGFREFSLPSGKHTAKVSSRSGFTDQVEANLFPQMMTVFNPKSRMLYYIARMGYGGPGATTDGIAWRETNDRLITVDYGLSEGFPGKIHTSGRGEHTREKIYRRVPILPSADEAAAILNSGEHLYYNWKTVEAALRLAADTKAASIETGDPILVWINRSTDEETLGEWFDKAVQSKLAIPDSCLLAWLSLGGPRGNGAVTYLVLNQRASFLARHESSMHASLRAGILDLVREISAPAAASLIPELLSVGSESALQFVMAGSFELDAALARQVDAAVEKAGSRWQDKWIGKLLDSRARLGDEEIDSRLAKLAPRHSDALNELLKRNEFDRIAAVFEQLPARHKTTALSDIRSKKKPLSPAVIAVAAEALLNSDAGVRREAEPLLLAALPTQPEVRTALSDVLKKPLEAALKARIEKALLNVEINSSKAQPPEAMLKTMTEESRKEIVTSVTAAFVQKTENLPLLEKQFSSISSASNRLWIVQEIRRVSASWKDKERLLAHPFALAALASKEADIREEARALALFTLDPSKPTAHEVWNAIEAEADLTRRRDLEYEFMKKMSAYWKSLDWTKAETIRSMEQWAVDPNESMADDALARLFAVKGAQEKEMFRVIGSVLAKSTFYSLKLKILDRTENSDDPEAINVCAEGLKDKDVQLRYRAFLTLHDHHLKRNPSKILPLLKSAASKEKDAPMKERMQGMIQTATQPKR